MFDLISTAMLPTATIYFYYLLTMFVLGQQQLPFVLTIVLAITYGVQILIFTLKQEFEYFIWLIVYILAMPIWNIILPLYAFWKFDDFSWGKTREQQKEPTLPSTAKSNKVEEIGLSMIHTRSDENLLQESQFNTLSKEELDKMTNRNDWTLTKPMEFIVKEKSESIEPETTVHKPTSETSFSKESFKTQKREGGDDGNKNGFLNDLQKAIQRRQPKE